MCITLSHHSTGRRPTRGDLGSQLSSVIDDHRLLTRVTATIAELISALDGLASERTVVVHDDHVEVFVAGDGRMTYSIVDAEADLVAAPTHCRVA